MPLIVWFCLNDWPSVSINKSKRSGEIAQPCLHPRFRIKDSDRSPLTLIQAEGLSYSAWITLVNLSLATMEAQPVEVSSAHALRTPQCQRVFWLHESLSSFHRHDQGSAFKKGNRCSHRATTSSANVGVPEDFRLIISCCWNHINRQSNNQQKQWRTLLENIEKCPLYFFKSPRCHNWIARFVRLFVQTPVISSLLS